MSLDMSYMASLLEYQVVRAVSVYASDALWRRDGVCDLLTCVILMEKWMQDAWGRLMVFDDAVWSRQI